ncbi:MAG: aldo/keto reductase, partial [Bacteroidales bacterium]
GLLDVLENNGVGFVAYSPLAQGVLTDRYLNGIPSDSRASKAHFLKPDYLTPELLYNVRKLNEIALGRGQTLAQMATAWLLRDSRVTSVIVGVSSVKQLDDNIATLENIAFSKEEESEIILIISAIQ